MKYILPHNEWDNRLLPKKYLIINYKHYVVVCECSMFADEFLVTVIMGYLQRFLPV